MDAITESRLRLAIRSAPRYADRLREAVAASLVTVPPDAVSWRHASDPRPWLETAPRFRLGRLARLAADACRRCERFVEAALEAEMLLRHGIAGRCPDLRATTNEELEEATAALVEGLERLLAAGRDGRRSIAPTVAAASGPRRTPVPPRAAPPGPAPRPRPTARPASGPRRRTGPRSAGRRTRRQRG